MANVSSNHNLASNLTLLHKLSSKKHNIHVKPYFQHVIKRFAYISKSKPLEMICNTFLHSQLCLTALRTINKKHDGIGNGTLKKIVTDTTQIPYLYTFIHLKIKLIRFCALAH